MSEAPVPMNDMPRDDHLRAALRHAPDRHATPPAAVEARILDAARRAAAQTPDRSPTARTRAPWWKALLERAALALDTLLRPGAVAALASVMLATVIGVMWRDGPPPDARFAQVQSPETGDAPARATAAMSERAATGPSTPAASQAATPAPARELALAVPDPTTQRDAQARARSSEGAPAPVMADATRLPPAAVTAQARAQAESHADAEQRARTPSAAPAPAAAPLAGAAATDHHAAMSPAEPPGPAGTAQAPSEDRAAAKQANGEAPQRREATTADEAGAAPLGAAREQPQAPRSVASRAARAPAAAAAPPEPSRKTAAEAGASAPDPLALPSIDALGLPRGVVDAIEELRELTRGQWAVARLPRDSMPRSATPLRAASDGSLLGHLLITDTAVWWQPQGMPPNDAWRAPLSADRAAAMRARLAAALSEPATRTTQP